MFCSKCGVENSNDNVFCFKCGADLRKVTPQSSSASTSTDIDSGDTIYDRAIGLSSGTLLGNRYRLESELGRGGMGVVYKAFDTKLERAVAIKLLPEALARNTKAVKLLKQEANISLTLTHPNIVRLINFEETDSEVYLVMEYIEGESLADMLLEKKKLSADEALGISRQVLEALSYAHTKKVVHRDLKPANIIITPQGEAKVLDFGIARLIKETMTKLTGTTATSGTLLYMAPEQLQGGMHQDGRVDIWAFGIVLYEMLTGGTPFNSDYMILHEPIKSIQGIPEWINGIIKGCLIKNPDDRFKNAEEVKQAIINKKAKTVQNASIKDGVMETTAHRNYLIYGMIAAILLGVIIFGGYIYIFGNNVKSKTKMASFAVINNKVEGTNQTISVITVGVSEKTSQKNLKIKNEPDMTALMAACLNGHADIANILINSGIDINEQDKNGDTALMFASYNGSKEIVKALLDKGAHVTTKDRDGDTALMFATSKGYTEIINMLKKAGAKE